MSQIEPRVQAVIDSWVQAIKTNGGEPFDRQIIESALGQCFISLNLPLRPIRWIENLELAFTDISEKIKKTAARDAAWDAARAAAWEAAWDAARAAAWAAARAAAWEAAWDAARDAAWDAATNPFVPLIHLARHVEVYWVMTDEVVFVPKAKLYTDERARLHRTTGKAAEYLDGSGYWFFKGVHVTEQIILYPETLEAKTILKEPNAEVRRVMIERLGLDRFLSRAKAQPIHTDESRALYKIAVKGDEPIVAVKVQCPSTGQVYFLRVPPQIDRCDKAVAWTFGFDKVRDYQPVVET